MKALIKYEAAAIEPDEILEPGQKSSVEIEREKKAQAAANAARQIQAAFYAIHLINRIFRS
jgi:hypothetical protein